jgi:hypothetical protein
MSTIRELHNITDDMIVASLFERSAYMLAQLIEWIDEALIDVSDSRLRALLRVFKRNSQIAYRSVHLLIDKLESRPMRLESARQIIDAATEQGTILDALKLLGAIRVQDAEFDQEVDLMREYAHARLREINGETEPVIDAEENQIGAES